MATQPDHLPCLEEVLLVRGRAVGRIGHARAEIHLFELAPVIAGGNRRAGARDLGDTGLEEAISPAEDHLLSRRPDEGSLEIAERGAADIGRDRGHQRQVLL